MHLPKPNSRPASEPYSRTVVSLRDTPASRRLVLPLLVSRYVRSLLHARPSADQYLTTVHLQQRPRAVPRYPARPAYRQHPGCSNAHAIWSSPRREDPPRQHQRCYQLCRLVSLWQLGHRTRDDGVLLQHGYQAELQHLVPPVLHVRQRSLRDSADFHELCHPAVRWRPTR